MSQWLVGNQPAAAGAQARPRLLHLLVFGLPSLLFLRALVQNRPLGTDTHESKPSGLTSNRHSPHRRLFTSDHRRKESALLRPVFASPSCGGLE